MMPMPSDSVKKACPSAASTTWPLMALQSGVNRKAAARPKESVATAA